MSQLPIRDTIDRSRQRSRAAGADPSSGPVPELVLPTLDLHSHLQDPSSKQRFVTVMFDVIARRYDRFTRLFSLGMDAGWKRQLMSLLDPDTRAELVVDLACGTGDLAAAAAARWPKARILGVDVSHRMLRHAAARFDRSPVTVALTAGDMIELPLADETVDVVTVGYGVRNAPTTEQALAEIARVLRPGGSLLVLDFYRPSNRLWRTVYLSYLQTGGSLMGWLWHRTPVAYGYLGPSVASHVTIGEFETALRAHGFTVERARPKLFGGIALHVAARQ